MELALCSLLLISQIIIALTIHKKTTKIFNENKRSNDLLSYSNKLMLEELEELELKITDRLYGMLSAILENKRHILDVNDKIDRDLLAPRAPLEPATPIRPNNWESMKEAFSGPVRKDE